MGITRREAQILELQEQGLSAAKIAEQLGLSKGYVEGRLSGLSIGTGEDRAWNSMVRAGTAMLADAIRRHHPERCS